jgi:DNA polymerase I-like protein with 3'-5' exonuclease and polymerase domains
LKQIKNFSKATVSDIEADNLLSEATLIHVLSCELEDGKNYSIKGSKKQSLINFFNYHIKNEIPVVFHNGICYDIPLAEKLLEVDLKDLMVIDTLPLSWYLNVERDKHGLDSFFSDYGIQKPKIDDWENLTYEEYKFRCTEDVKINKALWEDFMQRLYDMYSTAKNKINSGEVDTKKVTEDEELYIDNLKGLSTEDHINRFLTFLMSKQDKVRLREKTRILIDQELLNTTDKELEDKLEVARKELESVMPSVPVYSPKNKPTKPIKKDGSLSASGHSWNEAIEGIGEKDHLGNDYTLVIEGDNNRVKVLKGYKEPNINSSDQIKKWIFSKGWKPTTFNFVKDKEAQQRWAESGFRKELRPEVRKVPQLSVEGKEGKELCPSVLKLVGKVPEIRAYSGYTLLKHRYDVIQGFKREMCAEGYVSASVQGFTNTLREQHRVPVVNLPSVDRPYGSNIRGLLTCDKVKETLIGSDLSSLEDRVKNHFCLPHDPEYIKSISVDGFDPHVFMAYSAGYVSKDDLTAWYAGDKRPHVKEVRGLGKTVNYSSVYGAGAETIARSGDMKLEDAKKLHKAYWEVHWYVKAIAAEQCLFECSKGLNWLINPVNGFCYNIRSDKDIFSTLIQGTGSYFFDVWVDNILETMLERWKSNNLILLMHDELACKLLDKKKAKQLMEDLFLECIEKVNQEFKLRIDLGCDVNFGKSYAEIH